MPRGDPWQWTESDVEEWLQTEFEHFVADLPNVKIPSVSALATAFLENDVSGMVLLSDVTADFLKTECSIKSLGQRSTVLEAIRRLRRISSKYRNQDDDLPHNFVPPAPTPISSPRASTRQLEGFSQAPPSGLSARIEQAIASHSRNVRAGEELVEDQRGRKRRKLDLTVPQAKEIINQDRITIKTNGAREVTGAEQMLRGYLKDAKMTADSLVYGAAIHGKAIDGDGGDGPSDDAFAFVEDSIPIGTRRFVQCRMHQIFQNMTVVDVTLHGQRREAIRPYPRQTDLSGFRASLMVLAMDESEEAAIRVVEDDSVPAIPGTIGVTDSSGPAHDPFTDIEGPGPFDYLKSKWPDDGKDILPQVGISDSGEEADSEEENELDEMEASEQTSSKALTSEDAEEIIQEAIAQYAARWRTMKLPALERDLAYKVWKNARGQRGRQWVEATKSQIMHLDLRLSHGRRDILQHTWPNQNALVKQCAAIQNTIEDLEELHWKISVSERSLPPQRPPRPAKQAAPDTVGPHSRRIPAQTDAALSDFVVSDIDGEENTLLSNSPRDDLLLEPPTAGGGDDLGIGDLRLAGGLPEDMHSLSDDLRLVDDVVSEARSKDSNLDEDEPMPEAHGHETHSTPSELRSRSSDGSLPELDPAPLPPQNDHIADEIEIIDISSDTDSAPSLSQMLKSSRAIKPRDDKPELANRDEIESWDLDELADRNDRKRLLLKILLTLQEYQFERFAAKLKSEIEPIRYMVRNTRAVLDQKAGRSTAAVSSLALEFAKLYACWNRCDNQYWDHRMHEDVYMAPRESDIESWAQYMAVAIPKIARMREPGDLYYISSEEESPSVPHKKGQRVRQIDQDARDRRYQAAIRMKRFEESQQQSNENAVLSQTRLDDDNDDMEKVEVNLVREENENPIYLDDSLVKRLKQHQIDGIRFLWREVMAEGNEGCILAHTMGLGKTCQAISFLVTIQQAAAAVDTWRQIPDKLRPLRVLILCPPAILENWLREVAMWSPTRNFFQTYKIDATGNHQGERLENLRAWSKTGGILVMGYNLFARCVNIDDWDDASMRDAPDNSHAASITSPGGGASRLAREQQAEMAKILTERPNLVIADEAHVLKSDKTKTSIAASKIKHATRIALSGTPLSNNTEEIFSLIDWVAPNFLGNRSEFTQRFAKPIENGTYAESSAYEKRQSLKKLHILRNETEPKIHRRDITALKGHLTTKTEYNLTVPLSDLQHTVYEKMIEFLTAGNVAISQIDLFTRFSLLGLLLFHPRALRDKLLQPQKTQRKKLRTGPSTDEETNADEYAKESLALGEGNIDDLGLTPEAIHELLSMIPDKADVSLSHRMLLIKQILDAAKKAGDKTLLFSHRLPILNQLEGMLRGMGIHFGRLDGSMTGTKRDAVLLRFQQNEFDVLLISTRAGGQGLNIQNANRVIIADFGFNPTWEQQAVGRAYRLGQKKDVFVYRFVTGGTFEDRLYNMGLFKSSLFQRVVDKKNPVRQARRDMREWLFPPQPVEQGDIDDDDVHKDPLVLEKILSQCAATGQDSFIRNIKTMETLLKPADDEELTAEEKAEVDIEIDMMKNIRKGGLGTVNRMHSTMLPPSTAPMARGLMAQSPTNSSSLRVAPPSTAPVVPARASSNDKSAAARPTLDSGNRDTTGISGHYSNGSRFPFPTHGESPRLPLSNDPQIKAFQNLNQDSGSSGLSNVVMDEDTVLGINSNQNPASRTQMRHGPTRINSSTSQGQSSLQQGSGIAKRSKNRPLAPRPASFGGHHQQISEARGGNLSSVPTPFASFGGPVRPQPGANKTSAAPGSQPTFRSNSFARPPLTAPANGQFDPRPTQ